MPEIKFRIPANINGGIVSTPILIPKKVVPQKNATQNKARYSLVFKRLIGLPYYVLLVYQLNIFSPDHTSFGVDRKNKKNLVKVKVLLVFSC